MYSKVSKKLTSVEPRLVKMRGSGTVRNGMAQKNESDTQPSGRLHVVCEMTCRRSLDENDGCATATSNPLRTRDLINEENHAEGKKQSLSPV